MIELSSPMSENDKNKREMTAEKIQDNVNENRLRPKSLSEYIGQSLAKKNLKIISSAAKQRNESIDHILLHGPPGLGKTTLAGIIANEHGVGFKVTSGPAVEKPGDIASILSNLKENDVLFIDEIHRLRPVVEEILYTAMEDFAIDLVIGKGPSARSMRINVPKFTLVGATTKLSSLSSPLRDRFGALIKLEFYSDEELADIILRSASILDMSMDREYALRLAKCSRKTPRIANRLLRRVRDFSDVHHGSEVTNETIEKTLSLIGVDESGLDRTDLSILETIIENYAGGPVGLSTLSAAINEEQVQLKTFMSLT